MSSLHINKIAVIGLGRMGHGIAQAFAAGGCSVKGWDESPTARQSARKRIRSNLSGFVNHGAMTDTDATAALDRFQVCNSQAEAVSDAQFVVEAIAEVREVKVEWFRQIESLISSDTIVASNSSTFTVRESAVEMKTPERAIVTHWFNPPHLVPTVEVVAGPNTKEEVTTATIDLHNRIGKQAVRVNKEVPGFLVNRVQIAMIREVWDLYEQGVASAEDIDRAIRGSLGFRLSVCGPLSVCDFGGLDIWSAVYARLIPDLRRDTDVPDWVTNLVEAGSCGASSGDGIHDYTPESVKDQSWQRDELMIRLQTLMNGESQTG